MDEVYDLAVIGGGVNGCGIARDAAGRGLSVYLCEMNDLASGTSSWSTKLVHGGLRYLEYYEFRLVREALIEREVLWRAAPHIIEPLRFVLPHHAGLRPAWLLRLGLFLYDHIGGRQAAAGDANARSRPRPAGAPLKPGMFKRGFEYSDCRVDDARLVVLNARDAADQGASWRRRTRAVAGPNVGARVWRLHGREPARASAPHDPRAGRSSTPRAPGSRTCFRNASANERQSESPPGAGFAYRRSAPFRSRPVLHVPERRWPDHLRNSLRTRFHADRHDRSRLRRRSQPRRAPRPEEVRLSLRRGAASISPEPSRPATSSGAFRACARSTTTGPAKRRRRRATMSSMSIRASRARRSCRSSAARSPPTGAWRRRR